jgi:tellurite resistance protein TehA-like permease
VKPDVFAAVMATGIVSIAAADHGHHTISDVLVLLAAVGLPVLVLMTVIAWRRTPLDLGTPEAPIQLLTFVAACAVVGTRLEWIPWLHRSLAIVAALGWLVLLPIAVRAMWRRRWTGLRDHARGGGELVSVATSGLAILAADFGATDLAIGLVALALCFYIAMTGLVVWRAAHRSWPADLLQPDMWILMGAVAIATLAGDQIHKAGVESIRPVTIVTWIVATVWIPPLILVGAQRIRRRREVAPGMWWAAVFPLGMYSSATFASAVATGWTGLKTISLVFFWIALAAWGLTALGWLMQVRANGQARNGV